MQILKEIEERGEYLKTEKVDDQEVEVYYLHAKEGNGEPSDPFQKRASDLKGIPQNMRRRGTRLEKRAEEEVGSKAMAPEDWVTAYDILQVVPPPHDLQTLATLYESNASHNAAVTMKAVNICGLGYEWTENPKLQAELEELQKKNKATFEAKLRALKIEKLELDEALYELNDDYEFNEIMVNVWTDVESMGNGYLEVGRNRKGEIKYIGHVPAQTIRVRASRDGYIQMVSNKHVFFHNYGVYNAEKEGESIPDNPLKNDDHPNELVHFLKYTPTSTYYGAPDIIAALAAAVGDKFAREYNLDYFENKAVPRYAFILKGAKLSKDAENNLINYFRNELKGKHHGTLYIPLPATFGNDVEAEFQALEVGIQDQSFANYIKENRQEILMVHRVPPGKVGVYANANLAISRDADKTFKEQVCGPEQRRVEKKLKKIFSEWTDNFDLKFIEADIIDADIQSRIYDRYLRTQVMVPNEVRSKIGLQSRDDGNEPLPYEKGKNEGGPGQKTSDGAKPTRGSSADATGTRQVRGQAQSSGRQPERDRRDK